MQRFVPSLCSKKGYIIIPILLFIVAVLLFFHVYPIFVATKIDEDPGVRNNSKKEEEKENRKNRNKDREEKQAWKKYSPAT